MAVCKDFGAAPAAAPAAPFGTFEFNTIPAPAFDFLLRVEEFLEQLVQL